MCKLKTKQIKKNHQFIIRLPAIAATYICVLIGCDGDELRLREDEGLSFGREEGILCAVLLHLHDVETRLVLVERLEHDHLERTHRPQSKIWYMWFKILRFLSAFLSLVIRKQQRNKQEMCGQSFRWKYLCHIIGAALVVGELEFAERHFLPHPVSSCVGRVGVHVHPVPWKERRDAVSNVLKRKAFLICCSNQFYLHFQSESKGRSNVIKGFTCAILNSCMRLIQFSK